MARGLRSAFSLVVLIAALIVSVDAEASRVAPNGGSVQSLVMWDPDGSTFTQNTTCSSLSPLPSSAQACSADALNAFHFATPAQLHARLRVDDGTPKTFNKVQLLVIVPVAMFPCSNTALPCETVQQYALDRVVVDGLQFHDRQPTTTAWNVVSLDFNLTIPTLNNGDQLSLNTAGQAFLRSLSSDVLNQAHVGFDVSLSFSPQGPYIFDLISDGQLYTLVSVATTGVAGNGASVGAVFSGDSRIVAFTSAATNLVSGDTNGVNDVFVRDLAAWTTTRVSVATDGSERPGQSGLGASGAAHAYGPNVSLSQDGGLVAFTSRAALDPTDTNGIGDIYVRDRVQNQTARVSVASNGVQGNADSFNPQISGNGRYVIFTSSATTLVPGDTNGVDDVFLRDRMTSTTTRVSLSSTGNQLTGPSYGGHISADGRIVAFVSEAQVVPTADPVPCDIGQTTCGRAYVLDRQTNTVTRLPLPAINARGAAVLSVDLTPDGRFVAMSLGHSGALGSPTPFTTIATYDRQTGRVELDRDLGGAHGGDVTINANGRLLAVGGGWVRAFEVGGFAFDRQLTEDIVSPELPPDSQHAAFPAVRFSGDGLRLLFNTPTSHVPDPGDTNNLDDVYILNRDTDLDGMPDAWETLFGLNPNDPNDAGLDNDNDGVTNLQEYLAGTNPNGTFKRYFAEGAANGFFATRLALFNPNAQATVVVLEFLGGNGQTRSTIVPLPAYGYNTVTLSDQTGVQPDDSFGTVIEADRQVVADRNMSWDKTGYGSHGETAIESPGTTWYLAEGSTGGAFDLFYLLQNPGATTANVTVNYLRPAPAPPIVKTYTVGPKSRLTIYVNLEGANLVGTDLSAKITSDQPILAERAMYFSTPTQPFAAGHEGAAVAAPAMSWFLAEGATGSFFDMFLLLANAETTDAQVKVTYLLPGGSTVVKTYKVTAQSRLTINVNFEDPLLVNTPVSTIVQSTNGVPVIAERAMWWPSPNWYEAHLSAGSTTTGTRWAIADGLVSTTPGSESETYILLANTSDSAGTADVTLYFSAGTPMTVTKTFSLPPHSRVNVQVSVEFPNAIGRGFGALIQSSGPALVVERALYTNANGQIWAAGSNSLATKLQ